MIFRIIKATAMLVTGTMAGWALYRSLEASREQVEEQPELDGPRPDFDAEQQPEPPGPRASVSAPQNLRKVRGIGPGIENLLTARGITTWAQLAATEASALQAILDEAGARYRGHDPSTWPAQAAELAKAN